MSAAEAHAVAMGNARKASATIATRPGRPASARQFGLAPLEEPAFGLLACERDSAPVGRSSSRRLAHAPQQVCLRRVREVIVLEIAASEYGVDQFEAGGRAVAHRDGDRAIE